MPIFYFKKSVFIFFLMAASVALGPSALGCPLFLRGVYSEALAAANAAGGTGAGDVCAFFDRYEAARTTLLSKGVNPDMISDVRAPRLINLPDWKAHTSGMLGIFGDYNPVHVYPDPSGKWTVWGGWDEAAHFVDSMAKRNFESLASGAGEIVQVDLDLLTRIHRKALAVSEPGLAGVLRADGTEIGTNFHRATASKVSEIQAVDKNEYASLLHPGQGLVSFHRTQCYDELSASDRADLDSEHRSTDLDVFKGPGSDFRDASGVLRHCGYFVYADGAEVRPQLALLFQDISRRVDELTVGPTFAWQTGADFKNVNDPLRVAARAQRWFVSIHPFGGGNGRTSRFFMDYIIESMGLPAPTFENMNQDILLSESEWAKQIATGMKRVVGILENCVGHIHAKQCQTSGQ